MVLQNLLLDASIRDYVMVPMVIIVFVFGLLRFYLTKLMTTPGEGGDAQKLLGRIEIEEFERFPEIGAVLEKAEQEHSYTQILQRSRRIRYNCGLLSKEAVALRKAAFWRKDEGILYKKIDNNPMASMMNPAMMSGMLKHSFSSQIYQLGLFMGLGYFFSGFVLAKLPFGLTQKFKSMLHQGFKIPLLDVSFVSSMSLAFLLIYGLQGIFSLIFDSSAADEALRLPNNPSQMMGAGPQAKDFGKLFESERDSWDLLNYTGGDLEKAEDDIIKMHEEGNLYE